MNRWAICVMETRQWLNGNEQKLREMVKKDTVTAQTDMRLYTYIKRWVQGKMNNMCNGNKKMAEWESAIDQNSI